MGYQRPTSSYHIVDSSLMLTVAERLGCKTTDDITILSCLQTQPAESILAAVAELPDSTFAYLDDSALSVQPFFLMEPEVALRTGAYNRVPLIVGEVIVYIQ